MTKKIFLFDLDGTLLLSGGAGLRAMETVFMDLYGLPEAFSGIRPDGMIDTGIFRDIIKNRDVQVPDVDEAIAALSKAYIVELEKEMPVSHGAVLMPGMPELLDKLAALPDTLLGLVTGNLEQGARIKLERFDLNRYFSFGAFGSDHEVRAELVRMAVARAQKDIGEAIPIGKNVFVIGDTPKDIDCGKANNAVTVAVATGNYTVDQLKEAGADFVFSDFENVDRVVNKLTAE